MAMDYFRGLRPALMIAAVAAVLSAVPVAGFAHHRPGHGGGPGGGGGGDGGGGGGGGTVTEDYQWMHIDVGGAWTAEWDGSLSHITIVDDFDSGDVFEGRLQDLGSDGIPDIEIKHHGEWTSLMASMVAPKAEVHDLSWNSTAGVTLHDGFDVINASYGLWARNAFAGAYVNDPSLLGQPHESVVDAARNDLAFVAKAAGNDGGKAVGQSIKGSVDVLSLSLIGAPGAVFVGALNWNPDGTGAGGTKEAIAPYSTIAGDDPDVQAQFLVVGVEGGRDDTTGDNLANHGDCGAVPNGTCLYGTSFAAPIVAGYAAIVAEKFTGSTAPAPSAVAQQLLETARTDTIVNYDISVHGQGEACLSCALAPASLN